MSLKTERAIDEAITTLHASKWDKLKRFGRKSLLSAVSAISIASGMMGTSMQMQAHEPESYTTVRLEDLDAYLKGQKTQQAPQNQQQYAEIYANRDSYRRQHSQASYGSDQWLEEHGYEYDPYLSDYVNPYKYLGAFIDWNCTDRYGHPTSVVYLPTDPIHDKPIRTSMDNAKEMRKHPGGDTLGIYHSPTGTDINNPENNSSWGGFGGYCPPSNAGTAEKVIRTVDAAARTAHTILHIVKGHRR